MIISRCHIYETGIVFIGVKDEYVDDFEKVPYKSRVSKDAEKGL